MDQLLAALNLEEARALRSRLNDQIEMLEANENLITIKNTVDKQGYCVFSEQYTIDKLQVMPLPVKVCTTTYDKFEKNPKNYTIEFDDEQHDWYDILNHSLGEIIPEDSSITRWCRDSDWDDPISGSGMGYVYLYYGVAEPITAGTRCLVVTSDGDILKAHKQLDKCNELILMNKAVPLIYNK